jgi:hypothetical protein
MAYPRCKLCKYMFMPYENPKNCPRCWNLNIAKRNGQLELYLRQGRYPSHIMAFLADSQKTSKQKSTQTFEW